VYLISIRIIIIIVGLAFSYLSGSDVERQALWLEWYSTAQEKNTTVRRETELSFKYVFMSVHWILAVACEGLKNISTLFPHFFSNDNCRVRELELVGKYTKLEKNLRELSEKDGR